MDGETKTQTCTKCGQTKAIDEYAWRPERQAYRKTCKACKTPANRAANRRHYVKTRHTETYQKVIEKNRKWYKVHYAAYYAKNREQILAANRTNDAKRVQTDIPYRLKKRLRSRIAEVLRTIGRCKCDRSLRLIGCTAFELKAHIEKQFTEGMTWAKFGYGQGKFQIDHIVPIAMFDLTDPNQQCKAFHYTNLQPLWWEDHQAKTKIDQFRIRNLREVLSNLWTLDQIRAASVSA